MLGATVRASGMPDVDGSSPARTVAEESGARTCAICPAPAPAAGATVRATVEGRALWLSLLSAWPGMAAGGVEGAASSWADAVPAGSATERCRPTPAGAGALGDFATEIGEPREGVGAVAGVGSEPGGVEMAEAGVTGPG